MYYKYFLLFLEFCDQVNISNVTKYISHFFSENGITVTFKGQLHKHFHNIVVTLGDELSTFILNSTGIYIADSVIDAYIRNNSFTVARNSNLSFNVNYTNGYYSNCTGLVSIFKKGIETSKDWCSQTVCTIDSMLNISSCEMKTLWFMNVSDNLIIKYEMIMGINELYVIVNLTVVSINKNLSVYFTPKPPYENCSIYYGKNTNMTLSLEYFGKSSENALFINGSKEKVSLSKSLWFIFDGVGMHELQISVRKFNVYLILDITIQVEKFIYTIDFIPKKETYIASKTPITFYLVKKDKCIVFNNQAITWIINGNIISNSSNNNSSDIISHTFPSVGSKSRMMSVSLEGNQTSVKHIYVFDEISGFRVNVTGNHFCLNESITFSLSQTTGSDVNIGYKSPLQDAWLLVSDNKVMLQFNSKGSKTVHFKARNKISEMFISKDIYILEFIFLVLQVRYFEVNVDVTLHPKTFHSCISFYYGWQIENNSLHWKHGDKGFVPHLPYYFKDNGAINITLKVKFDDNSSHIEKSVLIYGEYPISNIKLISDLKNAYVDQNIYFSSEVLSNSSYFFYRWRYTDNAGDTWHLAKRSYNPFRNISFSTEGIHKIKLQVKNNITMKYAVIDVFVQFPLIIDQGIPTKVFAEINKPFEVVFIFHHSSSFPYTFQIYDGDNLNRTIQITQKNFKFTHKYIHDQNYSITFIISNKMNTISQVLPVSVLWPVQIFEYNINKSIVLRKSKYIIKVGDVIHGHITYNGTGTITFSWFSISSTQKTLIATGVNFSHSFNEAGNFQIMILGKNEVSRSTRNISLIVEAMGILDIKLVSAINGTINYSPHLAVPTNTLVDFEVFSTGTTNTILTYEWFLQDTYQDKVKKKYFHFTFNEQGDVSISVKVSTLFAKESKYMNIIVQTVLLKAHLVIQCGNNTKLENESSIPEYCESMTINHVYFDPTEAKYVIGSLVCYQNPSSLSKIIILKTTYKQSLSNNSGFSLKEMIGYIYCDVSLWNNVSEVKASYVFLKYLHPKLEFVEPKEYVKISNLVLYDANVHNISLNSTIKWYINNTNYCEKYVIASFLYKSSCSLRFLFPGIHFISITLSNRYADISSIFKVHVIEEIDIDVLPRAVEVSTTVRIHAISKNTNHNVYFWPEYNLTRSYIIYNANKAGVYKISLNVSSQLGYKKIVVNITVYPYFTFINMTTNSLYVKTNSNVTFYSSIVEPQLIYHWYVNDNLKPHENSWKITVFFNKFGRYNVTLNVSSPFRFAVTGVIINVLDPVSNITISSLNLDLNKLYFRLASSNFLIADKQYSFKMTWSGGGTSTIKSFSVTGVSTFDTSFSQGFLVVSMITAHFESNIQFYISVQNEISVHNASWNFYSRSIVSNLNPLVSQKYVLKGTIVKFWVENIIKNTSYSWHIGNKYKIQGPNISFNTSKLENVGRYLINVVAEGPFISNGSISNSFFITIFFDTCEVPCYNKTDIRDREIIKSQWLYSEVVLKSDCNIQHNWYFEIAHKDTNCGGFTSRKIYTFTGDVLFLKMSNLEVPPRSFEIGYYCVRNNITYGAHGVLNIGFLLIVKHSVLIPVISGGSYRIIGNIQDVYLNASNTIDPDVSYKFKSILLFGWSIYSTCCVGNDKHRTYPLSENNKVILISDSFHFQVNNTYYVQLVVRRKLFPDEKISEAVQEVCSFI